MSKLENTRPIFNLFIWVKKALSLWYVKALIPKLNPPRIKVKSIAATERDKTGAQASCYHAKLQSVLITISPVIDNGVYHQRVI